MPTSYYRDAKGAVLSQGRNDSPRRPKKTEGKRKQQSDDWNALAKEIVRPKSKNLELKYTPEGVCYNCLNRAHDICLSGSSAKTCVCRDRNHDDSEWWVPEGGRAEFLAECARRESAEGDPDVAQVELEQLRKDRDSMFVDLRALLRVLGLSDSARPDSPHKVMRMAIDKVAELVDRAEPSVTVWAKPVDRTILKVIDEAIAPPMSKQIAHDILNEIADGVDARIDALRDELRAGKT